MKDTSNVMDVLSKDGIARKLLLFYDRPDLMGWFIYLEGDDLSIRNHDLFDGHVRKFKDTLKDLFFCGFKNTVFPAFFDQELYLFFSDIGPFAKGFSPERTEHEGGAEGEEFDKESSDL